MGLLAGWFGEGTEWRFDEGAGEPFDEGAPFSTCTASPDLIPRLDNNADFSSVSISFGGNPLFTEKRFN